MLQSLQRNSLSSESKLFIFCDGPRNQSDVESVTAVRKTVREEQWCGQVEIIEQETNQGLANSIISGVSKLCDQFGRAIVLEDDLLLDQRILTYMNHALEHFSNDEKVMQVSGHMFPVNELNANSAFLMPFVTSWGWATWKRAWDQFDEGCDTAKAELRQPDTRKKFNLGNSYDYSSMLLKQLDGKIDSWAIRWNWTVFKCNGLVLYPPFSLISNHGFDGSGTHGSRTRTYKQTESQTSSHAIIQMPSGNEIASREFELTSKFLRKDSLTFTGRIRKLIKLIIRK